MSAPKSPNSAALAAKHLRRMCVVINFASRMKAAYQCIDTLVDNAGVAAPPFCRTEEGFEVTLGTNVIGTALLTHLLLPLVIASPTGRIVVLSSRAASRLAAETPCTLLPLVSSRTDH